MMTASTDVSSLRRFLGMTNHLGKFIPNLSELSQPLRELLSMKQSWVWGPAQEASFLKIKQELSGPTVLTLYDADSPAKVSADASSYGLGAVLLQKSEGIWKPVSYASRSMTETERRYAQIEKEALAFTWACERFSNYVLGKAIEIETDHKPYCSIPSTWTTSYHVFFAIDYAWPDTTTLWPASCCTQLTCCQEHLWDWETQNQTTSHKKWRHLSAVQ